ncbi:MAG TPA: Gldg family protein [Rudaea sp.]|nr:Gldg family protein [Rudaea sp.]
MTSNKKLMSGGALAVLAVLFVAVILICNSLFRGAQVDLTQNHLYTLSQGTKNILADIDEPIHLYLFWSDKETHGIPQLRIYAQRVREMLEEMAGRAHGKIKLEVIDPQPFSEDEDRATGYGLQAVPAGSNGEKIFLGIAGTNSTNGKSVIPFLQPNKEAFLEYDIAKLVHELTITHKPVVGLVSGLQIGQGFDPATRSLRDAWAIDQQLTQQFDVRELNAASIKSIDKDIAVLVLIQPKKLPPDAQYAIDQFVMRGGHLLVFVDPDAETDKAGEDPGNPQAAMLADKSSDLPVLFKAWGIDYDPHKVVLDRAHALQISAQPGAAPVPDPAILGFVKSDLSPSDVVTANLDTINVSSAGYFALAKGSKFTLTPLIQTSDDAMPVDSSRVKFLPDPTVLLNGYTPSRERYVVAGRLEGQFTSAFPDRKEAGHIAQAKDKGEIILVADTDLLSDRMWVQVQPFFGQKIMNAFANNGDFFINAVDNLTGSSDLISIRGRATSQRPFSVVEDMKRAAEQNSRGKEQELQQQLSDTERKLTELQSGKAKGSEMILSPAQQNELQSFLQKKVEIRKQLRQVRRDLDKDIDALGARLKFLNIALMPILITIAALLFAAWKRRRRTAA